MKIQTPALVSGLAGIQTGLRGLDAVAQKIASASVDRREPIDLAGPLVEAIVHQATLEASAQIVRRADEALASLLEATDR
ncbi:MAG: flagellar biosynthesis protein FlgE [Gammaproteobacteria bacterium]|nr:flagellar biosynthesis protein FlgE [Gammaproteobacteria bacterium]